MKLESLLYIADADQCHDVVDCLLDHAPVESQVARTGIKSGIAEDMLRLFSQAAAEILATVVGADATRQEVIMVERNLRPLGKVTGSIALSGDIEGMVAVSFNPELAAEVTARIAGCSPDELCDEDLFDGIGEITNQIAGRARTLMSMRNYSVEIDLPQFGQQPHEIDICDHQVPSYAIMFKCLGQRFALQLCFSDK
jgi:chemotaxis protein CheX